MRKTPSAFVVAGAASSSGKTVITLGIMEALRKRGLTVQPFKAGPDFIDPGHHAALLKKPSYNLDGWMMGKKGVRNTFYRNIRGSDIGVVEGVMGLFDGKDGEEGSTAEVSKFLGLPVVLVLDASKTARSIGATVLGFEKFDPGVDIRWVIFNKTGSLAHCKALKDAVLRDSKIKVLGCIPRDEALTIPSRHLGLVTSGDISKGAWGRLVRRAARTIEENIDLDGFLGDLKRRGKVKPEGRLRSIRPAKPEVRIAVARDRAFCFYYKENLEALESCGARLVPFSPLKDRSLPDCVDGIYIGGGYPELYGPELEANIPLRKEIKALSKKGLPIFAECGGLMYLGRSIADKEGVRYGLCGVFPWTTRMLKKRKALGYREVSISPCPVLPAGGVVRGHEYHYSEISGGPDVKTVFSFMDRYGKRVREGYLYRNTLASYVHVHFASNPAFAEGFVKMCQKSAIKGANK
jgi:cobyrinic acid a,c-diamide synthase